MATNPKRAIIWIDNGHDGLTAYLGGDFPAGIEIGIVHRWGGQEGSYVWQFELVRSRFTIGQISGYVKTHAAGRAAIERCFLRFLERANLTTVEEKAP